MLLAIPRFFGGARKSDEGEMRTLTGGFVLSFDFSYEVDLWVGCGAPLTLRLEEAQATAADLATG
ncbi:MAG TPA: hypothetical protein VGG72_14720 [Bryobacteraceae bacterium]|jgi:hypothetical protein